MSTADGAGPVKWPLAYQLQVPPGTLINTGSADDGGDKGNQGRRNAGPQTWWHYWRYRNPQNQKPEVMYSSTREESDRIAKLFLHEKVIGFDMEWPWDAEKKSRLQDKIGLIQLASPSTIALIHIGLHTGTTPDELIAPTLRAVLEAPHITKVGVGIMNADYSRLIKHFGLRPRGGFELSNLHFLTLYGHDQADKITTKLCGLAKQVEFHLGLPLWKGKARTSDWSKKLDEQQINYAADDAYAGLMLYHCMNAKRLAMAIVPRLPVHGDMYADALFPLRSQGIRPVWLVPESADGLIQTAAVFFKAAMIERGLLPAPPEVIVNDIANPGEISEWDVPDRNQDRGYVEETCRQADGPAAASAVKCSKQRDAGSSNAPFSKELYRLLAGQRLLQCRLEGCKPFMVASNKTLEDMARHRPTTKPDLLCIKGIGPHKAKLYGDEWLSIIKDFIVDEQEKLKEQSEVQPEVEEPHVECPQLQDSQSEHPRPEYPEDQQLERPQPERQEAFHQPSKHRRRQKNKPHEENSQPWRQGAEPVTPAPLKTRRVGRSLEILGTPPAMHTGLSFTMAEASLGEEARNTSHKHSGHRSSDSEGSAFGSPMPSPSADRIKRRRCSEDIGGQKAGLTTTSAPAVSQHTNPDIPVPPKTPRPGDQHETEQIPSTADAAGTPSRAPFAAPPSAPELPVHLRIFRQKLVAFSKMVASRLPPGRRPPEGQCIVPDATLDRLVAAPPATRKDLWDDPGIAPLAQACAFLKLDLFVTIAKWKTKEAAGSGAV